MCNDDCSETFADACCHSACLIKELMCTRELEWELYIEISPQEVVICLRHHLSLPVETTAGIIYRYLQNHSIAIHSPSLKLSRLTPQSCQWPAEHGRHDTSTKKQVSGRSSDHAHT